jgi:hypothetical protein
VSLCNNFLDAEYDVIIDWVAFWDDVKKYTTQWIKQGIEVRYVILWADEEIHLDRDLQRPTEIQMGERVMILRNEFLQSDTPSYFFLDNTSVNPENIIRHIQEKSQFLLV